MIKQAILGTAIGDMALSLRDIANLTKQLIKSRESVGTLINDQLAGYLVSSLCDKNKIFIDVGAHIGSVIAETKRRSKPFKIIAFEAMPDKVSKLKKKFPGIEIHNCAVSDETGSASFFVNDKRSGYSSLNKTDNTREIIVEKDLIDNLVQSSSVDVIKIDIEGAELGALRGAVKLINDSRPTIMFESAPHEVLGYTKAKMWDFFTDLGYQLFIPIRLAHTGTSLSKDSFIEAHHYPRRTTNYFAVHQDRVDEIRSKAAKLLHISY